MASTQAVSARKRATHGPIRTSSPGVASTVTTTVGNTQASTPLSGPRSTSYVSTTPLSGPMATSYVSAGNSLVYQTCTVPTETVAQSSFDLNDRLTTCIAIFSMTNNSTPMPIDSISSDISIGVPDNIKEKIVKSEYIDIGSLLPTNMHIENSQNLHVAIYQGELVLQKTQNKVRIDNIDQWTSAFKVFINIIFQVQVSHFQELLKYLHTVKLRASRSTSLTWKLYDE